MLLHDASAGASCLGAADAQTSCQVAESMMQMQVRCPTPKMEVMQMQTVENQRASLVHVHLFGDLPRRGRVPIVRLMKHSVQKSHY